jgi:hypothetical protein
LVPDFNIELGYLYGSDSGIHADPAQTRGMPGSRAPHIWLSRSGERVSTIHLTSNYLLLAGSDGRGWIVAAAGAAAGFNGLALDAWCVGTDLGDPEAGFLTTFGISSTGAVLVRPDGFVAWRSTAGSADCRKEIAEALANGLGLGTV